MAFDITKWYDTKLSDNVIVKFKGDITSEIITDVLDGLETQDILKDEKLRMKKKIFNVFVECFQNLYHHVDKPPIGLDISEMEHFGIIVLTKVNDGYKISTGNFVSTSKINNIKERIDLVNSISDNNVRKEYVGLMNNGKLSEKGGGGLGMLDIVRKTGNKIEYYFMKHDEENLFFSLDVYIS